MNGGLWISQTVGIFSIWNSIEEFHTCTFLSRSRDKRERGLVISSGLKKSVRSTPLTSGSRASLFRDKERELLVSLMTERGCSLSLQG